MQVKVVKLVYRVDHIYKLKKLNSYVVMFKAIDSKTYLYSILSMFIFIFLLNYLLIYIDFNCDFDAQPSQQKCEVLPAVLFDWFHQNMFLLIKLLLN